MKDIKGYESLYAITQTGDVWSYRRGKYLNPGKTKNGFSLVVLTNEEGEKKTAYIHRLVAETFCIKPNDCNWVKHKDGNRENNTPENLEWVKNLNQKNAAKPILCVETDTVYPSLSAASADTGVGITSISQCLHGKIKTSGGYHWKFI